MHKHHVIPKHAGGSDDPGNITPPIPVVRHSMFHWCEWPSSRGVIQNILKVLKSEDLKDFFNLDYRVES